MIIGIGSDLIDIRRIEKTLERFSGPVSYTHLTLPTILLE